MPDGHNPHHHESVQALASLTLDRCEPFGEKVRGLILAKDLGANVIPGFVVSAKLASRIAASNRAENYIRFFAPFVDALLSEGLSMELIARSSSAYEDRRASTFSGLFDSYSNVQSTEQLVSSIAKIVKNSKLVNLSAYFQKMHLDINAQHMGVLVQLQLDYEFGGLIKIGKNDVLVELTSGNVSASISGRESYSSLGYEDSRLLPVHILNRDKGISTDSLRLFLDDIVPKIRRHRDDENVLEFICKNDVIYVTQLKSGNTETSYAVPDGRDSWIGGEFSNKTKAMRLFLDSNLFDKDAFIIDAGFSLRKVSEAASQLFKSNKYVTVRLSRGSEIGLPRAFCETHDDVLRFVQSYATKTHDIILHGYIDVARSMELLITRDGFLLEHVPGMWESPNRLQPDVISLRDGVETDYLYKQSRPVHLDERTPFNGTMAEPLSDRQLALLQEFGGHVWRVISSKLASELPLNVHAVANEELTEFECLNIRPGFDLAYVLPNTERLRVVHTLSDLIGWTPDEAVRLALTTARGDERSLIPIAERLSKALHPIAIDFGVLSHPAMILREYGCKLIPSYLVPQLRMDDDYRIEVHARDVGYDPVVRILSEPDLSASASYKVVNDADPITESHFLCVFREASSSAVDSDCLNEVDRLYASLSEGGNGLFYERGRSEVCTSAFTYPRDHFHVVNGLDIETTIENLRASVGGQRFSSLADAYEAVPPMGPYIVYGSTHAEFFVARPKRAEKRVLRSAARI